MNASQDLVLIISVLLAYGNGFCMETGMLCNHLSLDIFLVE